MAFCVLLRANSGRTSLIPVSIGQIKIWTPECYTHTACDMLDISFQKRALMSCSNIPFFYLESWKDFFLLRHKSIGALKVIPEVLDEVEAPPHHTEKKSIVVLKQKRESCEQTIV